MGSRNGLHLVVQFIAALCVALPLAAAEPTIKVIADVPIGFPSFFTNLKRWAIGKNKSVVRTIDGGVTWKTVQQNIPGFDSGTEIALAG